MKKLITLFVMAGFVASVVFAGDATPKKEGILTPDLVAEIQNSFILDTQTRSAMNALQENNIRDLVKATIPHDTLDFIFSNKIEVKSVTDQESSGRCWLFAAFNTHRQQVAKKYNLDNFEFSENFALFWDKLEKANLFLEYVIMNPQVDFNDQEFILLLKNPIPDGGFFQMAANCIMKYGAVPKSVMPETFNSSNTDRMNDMLEQKLRTFACELRDLYPTDKSLKKLRARKIEMLKQIYRILSINLGEPPKQFQWRYCDKDGKMAEVKTYTPVQFWQEATDSTNLSDYVVIGNCPTQPYGKNYQVKLGRGQIEGTDWTFLNLDMSVLKDYASKILNDTVIVEFSADVGQQMDSKAGLMASGVLDYDSFYDLKFGFDKKVGIYSRESAPNHAMALIGYDKVNDKITKWKVENSWGTDRGKDGFFLMTDEWFDKYGYDLVIPKKYLSPEHLKLWETPPVVLPFWDPLARVAQVGGYQD